jgi:hypothetical protein
VHRGTRCSGQPRRLGGVTGRGPFPRWAVGCRQCSVRHLVRALRDPTLNAFEGFPLLRQALVPSSFRRQVNRMAQKSLPPHCSGRCHGFSPASRGAPFPDTRLLSERPLVTGILADL